MQPLISSRVLSSQIPEIAMRFTCPVYSTDTREDCLGFLSYLLLGRWETLKVSLKNPNGFIQDRTRNLRSDSQWSNQMSYCTTYYRCVVKAWCIVIQYISLNSICTFYKSCLKYCPLCPYLLLLSHIFSRFKYFPWTL